MNKPFFFVIICTYNRAKFLPRALKSLQKQTFKDFEVIVVDDGSTDNTKSVVKKFGFAKYTYQKNRGVGVARNTGINKSHGKFITFLDSDDAYLPKHLEFRFKYIEKYPWVDFFYNGYKIIGSPYVPDKNDVKKKIHLKYCLHGPTFVFKRQVFNAVGGYSPLRFAEDPDFFEKALKKNYKFLEIKKKTYLYYRDHESSITHNTYKALNKK